MSRISPSSINVLVACEESQAVCTAFRHRGFNAFSAGLQECSGGHPEWHVVGDVTLLLHDNCSFITEAGRQFYIEHWSLIIAHPPCTYLSMVSGRHSKGVIAQDSTRLQKLSGARDFFMRFFDVPADYIAIENPVPLHIANLPRPTTMVQPYHFGAPWSKRTCLWLVNLPPLMPTIINPKHRSWVHCTHGGKMRSKTFHEIAEAMANQWGDFILHDIAEHAIG